MEFLNDFSLTIKLLIFINQSLLLIVVAFDRHHHQLDFGRHLGPLVPDSGPLVPVDPRLGLIDLDQSLGCRHYSQSIHNRLRCYQDNCLDHLIRYDLNLKKN